MKTNKNGFTLVELLAVIVILGLLMAIAIPSVTKYITESRRKTLVSSIDSYVSALSLQVNGGEYKFTGTKVTYGSEEHHLVYAVPIECISLEKGGSNPFGNWMQANDEYWAYVLVHYDAANYNYIYGFTFKDDAGYGMYPTTVNNIDEKGTVIRQNLSLRRPANGSIIQTAALSNWNGFELTNADYLQVLTAEAEGVEGNGQTTCTLQQKGDNYEQVQKDKEIANNMDDYTLMAIEANTTVAFWQYRKEIRNVTFQDSINIPASVRPEHKWDVSVSQKGKVMAYVVPRNTSPETYDLYIQGDGKVYANPDSSFLFDEFRNLDSIKMNNFDTSRVISMAGMFYAAGRNSTIFTLDLGNNFDTSNVVDMEQLFNQAGYTSQNFTLDLGDKFDTSNVTNMHKMFWHIGYSNPNFTLDLGNKFNTSKVTNMKRMLGNIGYSNPNFRLDCSGWDVSNVTNHEEFYAAQAGKVTEPNWKN